MTALQLVAVVVYLAIGSVLAAAFYRDQDYAYVAGDTDQPPPPLRWLAVIAVLWLPVSVVAVVTAVCQRASR